MAWPITGSALASRWVFSSMARSLAFLSFWCALSRRARAMGPPRAMREVEKPAAWMGLERVFRRQRGVDIDRLEKRLARPRGVAMVKCF